MKFEELDSNTQSRMIELLNHHIAISEDILMQDHVLCPMLMIPDTKQLVSLQSKDGKTDVDKAYAAVIEKLKNEVFSYALFSYSTQIGLPSGVTDALKTHIFTSGGIEASFFTPYALKGVLKKSIHFEKTILFEVKEHIFDQ